MSFNAARSSCCSSWLLVHPNYENDPFMEKVVVCYQCHNRYFTVYRGNPDWRDGDANQKKWFRSFRPFNDEEIEKYRLF